jgi:hypothetical protein
MAQVPSVPLDPVQGANLPADGPRPTDFGLGQAASEAQRVAQMSRRTGLLQIRAQAAQDRQAAVTSPQFQSFVEADDGRFAAEAGAWNGQPGFAADQTAKTKAALAAATQAYAASGASPGQVSEFGALGLSAVARRGAAASDYEQRQLMSQAQDVQTATLNGYKTQGIAAQGAAVQKLYDGYDGSTPTLVPQVSQAFDGAWAPVIASAPDNLKPRLQLEASAMKAEAIAQATSHQGEMQRAYVATQGSTAATTLINSIYSNPSAYDTATAQFPQIAATLPAEIRARASQEWGAAAAQARISGLIDRREYPQALAELDDGRYDQVLKPEEKGALQARALAENRAHGPEGIAIATASAAAEARLQADIEARARTGRGILAPGQVDADVAAGILTADQAGRYQYVAQRADQAFAAAGPVYGMSNAQLAAAAAAPRPDPADVAGTEAYEARQQAVAAEQKARTSPGAWAWNNQGQQLGGQPLGAALQAKWQAATQGGPGQAGAMADYAGTMLGVQHQAGIAPGQMQIVPQAQAAQIAAAVTTAAPDKKAEALQTIARLALAVPAQIAAPDGTAVSARALFGRQLEKAGLTPIEVSAIADFGAEPAKLGRLVAALNDTTLKEPLKRGDPLPAQVRAQLAPFLASDPQGASLAEGRIQRTVLVARELEKGGMPSQVAAETAARDLTGDYQFRGGWRMPAALAQQSSSPIPFETGIQIADEGSHVLLAQLTANGGAGLYAPSTIAGGVAERQQIYASQIARSGAWKTLPDDSGLYLATPKADGTWNNVTDKWGRPVRATWRQLAEAALNGTSPFAAPPANQPQTPQGVPVRAFSQTEGGQALAFGVEQAESGHVTGLVSPKGAMGVMQIMPSTLARYAPQLGLPVDPQRAIADPAYNRKIGQAALFDLTQRYMTGAQRSAGVGLALAAYNAGEGRLTGYTDAKGYHPGWLSTIGDPRTGKISLADWVSRIPIPETRDYVGKVLGFSLRHLQGAD